MILKQIAKSAGIREEYLEKVASSASHRYKTYTIPKRKGGKRIIEHPAKELKFLQRWLVDNLFSDLTIHGAVYSYRKGVNIRDHAELHRGKNFLLHVDFANFFPSITSNDIKKLLQKKYDNLPILSTKDINTICLIVCKNNKLTIGAPSSPVLSNAVMYDFDNYWANYCRNHHVTYSRYADDIYFSTNQPDILSKLFSDLCEYLETIESPRLKINRDKTVFTSRKRKRLITGITLSSDNRISLGRKRKRWIKSLVFQFKNGALSKEKISYLRGYLAYVNSVDPAFVSSLKEKYGAEILDKIKTSQPTSRRHIKERGPK